jgi:GAF domain-containing protein/HAMP domain-containing protein
VTGKEKKSIIMTLQTNSTQEARETLRRNRTIAMSLVTSFLFLAITVIFAPGLLTSDTPNYGGFALTILLIIMGLVCAFLAWQNKVTLAASILLGAILILSLGAPIFGRGQGVSEGFLAAFIGIGIAISTLPEKLINRGVWLSVITGISVMLLDQVIPDFGFVSNGLYINIIAIIISAIFVVVVAYRFNSLTLRIKLIISFSFVTILPLLILGVYNNYHAKNNLAEGTREKITNISNLAAQQYDDFFEEQLNQISTDAKQAALVDYLTLPAFSRRSSPEETKAFQSLLNLQRKDPVFIETYALLDRTGRKVMDTSSEDIGRDESKFPFFTIPMETNRPYLSNIIFVEAGQDSIYLSAPVKDANGNTAGVLRVEYHASLLQYIAREIVPNDPDIVITLVDASTYLRLADTGDRDMLMTSFKDLTELEIAAMQAEGRLPAGNTLTIVANPDDNVIDGINNLQSEPFFESFSPWLDSDTTSTGKKLAAQPWIVLVSKSKSRDILTIQEQTSSTILISLAISALAIALAFFASQVIAAPLISLTKVVEKISSGDTTVRAQISTEDEVGALSESFNKMTDELNHSLSMLEVRVAERTTDLEISRQQSEKRANELQAVGEISRLISSEQKFESLLPLVTRLVSERFNLYHTAIYLVDETGQFALLQATSSEGGRKMLARGYKLDIDANSMIGLVAKNGMPRIALDVGLDAVYFNNPDLPGTRSEMILPLATRGKIVGVLDVQSDKPGAFTDEDVKTLSILTDQIAIAIENARLFEQNQQTLNEYQALYRQNIKQGWANFSREEGSMGYRQTISGGSKVIEPVETNEILEAINKGDILITQPGKGHEDSFIVIPIKLRGQIIGTLRVQAPTKNRSWTQDEINLAEAVSDRLSLALENARLIQESQKQVIKEQTITEVTSKIGASINLKNVLQTAVEELGRAMPGSEVLIRFDSNGKK